MKMKAIVHAPEKALSLEVVEVPELTPNAVLIRVSTTGINRADVNQAAGKYPVPPGASPYLGLEVAGTVIEVGKNVTDFKGGDRVMALLNGGGYAEQVVADAGCVLLAPKCLSDEEAGAFMETYFTAFLNIFVLGHIPEGGAALVHGGGSGIGTSAINLLKEAGMTSFVTAGSDDKCQKCLELGATHAINYKTRSYVDVIKKETDGAGVDVVLDMIGGPYLNDNITCLKTDGAVVFIATMGGSRAKEVDIGQLMVKRGSVVGSMLRARSIPFKADLVRNFRERFGAALEAGRLRPLVYKVLPLKDAQKAHELMESSEHFGKIVLKVQ